MTFIDAVKQLTIDLKTLLSNNLRELDRIKSDVDHDHILHLNVVFNDTSMQSMATVSNKNKFVLFSGTSSTYDHGHIYMINDSGNLEDMGRLDSNNADLLAGNPSTYYASNSTASSTSNGLMSKEDKIKLDKMEWQNY